MRAGHTQSENSARSACWTTTPSQAASSTSTINTTSETAANLQGAQAALEVARLNPELHAHRCAGLGQGVSRGSHSGQPRGSGRGFAPLTTVVSVSPMYASFDVDEQSYLRYAAPGAGSGKGDLPVFVGLANEDGYPHKGKITRWTTGLDTLGGTIRVRAMFDNADGRLVPGLYAKVKLGGGTPHTGGADQRPRHRHATRTRGSC